ncbi:MAG: YbaK/EbsC family protein [Alphaproteobacteria bacterium]|jgi:prolyl-tRNA editing enzyme YbaK/EbsC (Cys-tRNA(Pro) deacylase)|nr:YbaK/EbsC family protein [Alphaproteobacteria bacterium]
MTGGSRPRAIQRVEAAVVARGFNFEMVEFPASTRTAADAAAAIGCEIAQIVKSLIFATMPDERPLLALVSGSNQGDMKKMAALVGATLRRPDADYVREVTGFAIGGVPPIGHSQALLTLIDRDLVSHPMVWAAAGTPNSVFGLRGGDLEALTAGIAADIRRNI